jgi:pimeloyl-ACP methyl ester carboxylesterase
VTGTPMQAPTAGPIAIPTRFVSANGLRMRYLEWTGGSPPIVLLHGLSANANAFAAVGTALSPRFRVIAPDLRGRGATDKPATGYTMADHAADVVGLLDALGIERVVLGGHSFGGFLAIYVAVQYPQRVGRLVVIDAAMELNPNVREMLGPSLARLRQTYSSVDAYLDEIRHAPYMDGTWDWAMESYFRAELTAGADGTVRSATSADAVGQAMVQVLGEPWADLVGRVSQPTLLVNATADYGPPGAGALVPEPNARATARMFRDGRYARVSGNHLTMVFGANGAAVAAEIAAFAVGEER